MTWEELLTIIKKIQEPKGYFINTRDEILVRDVLQGLLVNKERFGYMSCPCRLSSGNREKDRDICCPCEYREADVKDYGCCFCQLYVSEEWNQEKIAHVEVVPERRPLSKMF